MKGEPTCPRCGGPVSAPGSAARTWQCKVHGWVYPMQPIPQPNPEVVRSVVRRADVPVWLPWPLPSAWMVTGVAYAGDSASGIRAVALACAGPSPLGGAGEMVLVAEEIGVGLGARYAGLPGPDPGPVSVDTVAHAKVQAAGHPTPLWCVDGGPDRAVFVGEAMGSWLWAVLWPETTGHLMYEPVVLIDLRDVGGELDLLPFGALSRRL